MEFTEHKIIDFIQSNLGITVHHIKFIGKSESRFCVKAGTSYRTVPYLDLVVSESSYDRAIGGNRNLGLAKGEIAEGIIDFIRNLDAGTFDKHEYYHSKMYIGVHSWDRYCYCDFAYHHKTEVQNSICKIVPVSPRSIYASSMPGLNIIYNSDDYKKYSIDIFEDKIKANVISIADDFVQKKYGNGLAKDVFEVKIWNPNMKGYNESGLARQD